MLIEKIYFAFSASFIIALFASCAAWCYVFILTKPTYILSGFARWINKIHYGTGCNVRESDAWWYKIILSCEYCISGQLALWTSVLYWCNETDVKIVIAFLSTIAAIVFSIVIVAVLSNKIKTRI